MRLSEALTLRPYQFGAVDALRSHIRAGVNRVVLIAPTGSGKTVMASAMVRGAVDLGKRSLFLVHRRELVDQSLEKLASFGVSAGVIMASDARTDPDALVQVASVQTLARRLSRLPAADLVIVDECHHAVSDSYRAVLAAYPAAAVIGLTATPWRSDKRGLRDMFDEYVLASTPAELIAGGALVGYEAFAWDAPDLHDVGMVAGDYNQQQLGLACNTGVLVGRAVHEYVRTAPGRPAIVFPVNIEHSRALVAQFEAAGFSGAHIDHKTPAEERRGALERFRSGALTVLSSVGVLTEGFDAPRAEVAVICRPTKSLTLHIQMLGRVLRTHPGKLRALIHDHAGNLLRLGLPDDPQEYALTATPSTVISRSTCPLCFAVFGSVRDDGTCPKCDELIAPPKEERDALERKQLEQLEGERLDAERIRAMREAAAASAPLNQRLGEFLRLRELAARKGYAKGWVAARYRHTFGRWPRFSDAQIASATATRVPWVVSQGKGAA